MILTIDGILTKCMIKLKTKAKQLWRRRRRALPHFYIQQDRVEFAGHGRGEQAAALWIFHDGAGNFYLITSHQMVKEMPLQLSKFQPFECFLGSVFKYTPDFMFLKSLY